tara:strand:+ start:303 stop:554 length:252 start_codon:yes stop_codon:yes gene_type:complete
MLKLKPKPKLNLEHLARILEMFENSIGTMESEIKEIIESDDWTDKEKKDWTQEMIEDLNKEKAMFEQVKKVTEWEATASHAKR